MQVHRRYHASPGPPPRRVRSAGPRFGGNPVTVAVQTPSWPLGARGRRGTTCAFEGAIEGARANGGERLHMTSACPPDSLYEGDSDLASCCTSNLGSAHT